MKDLFPIDVECYSGYKADQRPKCFYLNNMKIDIKEIIDQWNEAGRNYDSPVSDYFKVRTPDDKQFILKHEIDHDRWYLWIKGESLNLFD